MNLPEVFPVEKLAVTRDEPERLDLVVHGGVLGVMATCQSLGSPVLLGMERCTGEEVQDPRAGT